MSSSKNLRIGSWCTYQEICMYLVRSEVPKHTTSFFSGIFKLSSGDLATVASCFPTQQNQSLLLLIHFLTLAADCKIFPNTAESTVIPSSFILLTLSSSSTSDAERVSGLSWPSRDPVIFWTIISPLHLRSSARLEQSLFLVTSAEHEWMCFPVAGRSCNMRWIVWLGSIVLYRSKVCKT